MVGWYSSLTIVDGFPAIAYQKLPSRDLMYVRALDADGTSWGTPVVVDSNGRIGYSACLRVIDGSPAISYYDIDSLSIRFVRASDSSGATWGAPVIVVSGAVVSSNSLEVIAGRPAISYTDTTNVDLRYIRADDSIGSTWGSSVLLDSTGSVGPSSSLQVVDGNPAISYHDETNRDLKYVRALDAAGEAWGVPVLVDSLNSTGLYTCLRVINGNPAIAYQYLSGADLKYVHANDATGAAWSAPVLVDDGSNSSPPSSAVGYSPSLAVVNGTPAICHWDLTLGNLKYVRANDASGISWGSRMTLDVEGDPGNYCSMLVVNGKPAISYHSDHPHYDLKFIRANDANGAGGQWPPDIMVRRVVNTQELFSYFYTGGVNLPGGTVERFDHVLPGESAEVLMGVKNSGASGSAGLIVQSLTIDGPDAGQFSIIEGPDMAISIGSDDGRWFSVRHTPASPGPKNATLHINSNVAAERNPFDIVLSGKVLTSTASTHVVTSLNDSASASEGDGTLRGAILAANANDDTAAAIVFDIAGGGTIFLASQSNGVARMLPILTNPNGISIDGANNGQGAIVIDGGSTDAATGDRILFAGVAPNTPSNQGGHMSHTIRAKWDVRNLTLKNGNARGGDSRNGGGGGAGLGGAIFVNAGTLTLSSAAFIGNRATGGSSTASATTTTVGGGGGMGGGMPASLSSTIAGGGGFGLGSDATNFSGSSMASPGQFIGGMAGGTNDQVTRFTGWLRVGGSDGGAGGAGSGSIHAGGGGVGGANGGIYPWSLMHGFGGFGGGGNGGSDFSGTQSAGPGGYGGGGGCAGVLYSNAIGGFGGGGGGSRSASSANAYPGGFGGGKGTGARTTLPAADRSVGGGGAGIGGALFIRHGAGLSLDSDVTFADSSTTGGAGGAASLATDDGLAYGANLFLEAFGEANSFLQEFANMGAIQLSGNTALPGNSAVAVHIDDPDDADPVQSYFYNSQLRAAGSVTLNGAALFLRGNHTPLSGQKFVIVANDGVDATVGTFAGLPEGGTVTFNSQVLTISYAGGTGNDVTLTRAGTPIATPDISVEQPTGAPLVDGIGHINFGTVSAGASGSPMLFTIRNTGGVDLHIDTPAMSGTNKSDFAVNTNVAGNEMTAWIGPGGVSAFSVVFTPAASGARSALLSITSSDPDETPFVITLGGNNLAPIITSGGGGASSSVSVAENITSAATFAATDADSPAQQLSYDIAGGADAAKFSITSAGMLSFITAPDFEIPSDANADNNYLVNIQVNDAHGGADVQSLTVTVTNVIEPLQEWRLAMLGSAANAGPAADDADYDRDGLKNLAEFAFDTDPANGASGASALRYTGAFAGGGIITSTGQPIAAIEGTETRFLFVRRKNHIAAGLVYTPQFSAALGSWEDGGVTPSVLADDGVREIVSVPFPASVSGSVARFARLRISVVP